MSAVQAGDAAQAKTHAAAVSAALSAAAVYAEWAPLPELMRSGLMEACGHFLSSSEFRSQACEVLRHVAHRRRGDTINDAIKSGAKGEEATDDQQKENAADAAAVVSGITGVCRSLGVAAQHVIAAPPADPGSEEHEYARRLTETIATLASNHVKVVPDEALRVAFLEALLGLTKYPSLDVLSAAIPSWPGLLRGMGAELPGTFVRPEKGSGSGVFGAQQQGAGAAPPEGGLRLPPGAVVALLETVRGWLQQGGGIASTLDSRAVPGAKGDDWECEFESRDELREAWVMLRARLMECAKLCTALEPRAAAAAAASHVAGVIAMLAPGAALDPAKAAATTPDGRSAVDDGIGAAFEGAVSFVEPVMQALPLGGENLDVAAAQAVAPALETMLTQVLAVDLKTPVGVSQMSRLLEALGRAALVRPEAGTATLHRLFEILAALPDVDVGAPPARAKAAMMAGRTTQAARQRICAAVLGVCASAPEVSDPLPDPTRPERTRPDGGPDPTSSPDVSLARSGDGFFNPFARLRTPPGRIPLGRRYAAVARFIARADSTFEQRTRGFGPRRSAPRRSRGTRPPARRRARVVPVGDESERSPNPTRHSSHSQAPPTRIPRHPSPSPSAQVFNAHLEAFANQVESLRPRLSGAERGALAEALLAVAGPSGPARVREVLRWLLEPVRQRWVPAPGQIAPDLFPLASFASLAKGEANGGSQGLSQLHWDLFHDVQLAERCLRRSGGDHDPNDGSGGGSPPKGSGGGGGGAASSIPAGMVRPVDPPPPTEECPAADHLDWVVTLSEALCAATHRAWTPAATAEATAAGLDRALCMSPDEQAAHLVHGPARTFALGGGGLPPASETTTAARNWLRGLRDSAYANIALLSSHAPAAFYPSPAVAASVGRAIFADVEHMHDRHARVMIHMVVRPVLGRCPAAHRALWHGALTAGLVPHMHGRLCAAWSRVRTAAGEKKADGGDDDDVTDEAFAAAAGLGGGGVNTGGGSAAVEDLIVERVTRDLTRDHCALLELIAIPEGTFGRKTRGSGLTGHLRAVVGGGGGGGSGGGSGEGSPRDAGAGSSERLAHAGGRHILDWMAAVRAADASSAAAPAAVATAVAAVTWGDSDAVGKALTFLRGVVAAAASPEGDQGLREIAGAEILPACLGGLTVATNSAHQSELLGLIRDVVVHLLPVTNSVRAVLLGLPGMTSESLDRVLADLATIRSEKKAANRVKEMIVAAAGGGDALRAFAEARAGATSVGAIQVPKVTARRPGAEGGKNWTEDEVNAIGLNPMTANVRDRQ